MTMVPFASVPLVVAYGLLWTALCVLGARRAGMKARGTRIRLGRRLAIGGVIVGALLGPSVSAGEVEVTTNVEVFFAIDRTGSMAAEDWGEQQPRLDGVRRDVKSLVEATAGSRYGVVTWDSAARLELPVTTDSSAVFSLADALHQEISEFSSGSSINRPVYELHQALSSAKEGRPENFRFLIVLTDGESTDTEDFGVSPEWESLKDLIDGGAVIGYGTEEGGPMRIFRPGEGATEDYMMDPDDPAEKAISHLDKQNLEDLAEILGVPLLVNPEESQIEGLGADLLQDSTTIDDGRELQKQTRYIVWPLGVLGAALLIWELADFAALASRMWRSRAI